MDLSSRLDDPRRWFAVAGRHREVQRSAVRGYIDRVLATELDRDGLSSATGASRKSNDREPTPDSSHGRPGSIGHEPIVSRR